MSHDPIDMPVFPTLASAAANVQGGPVRSSLNPIEQSPVNPVDVDPLSPSALSASQIKALVNGQHGDPFSVLGMHHDAGGRLLVRALLPGAARVAVIESQSGNRVVRWLRIVDNEGLFEAPLTIRRKRFAYRLRVIWKSGLTQDLDDPYSFGLILSDLDIWLLAEGKHLRPYECMGAHPMAVDTVMGTRFTVWAPNAQRVSVVADFNRWDGRRHVMRLRREAGLWELFVPHVEPGARYKFELLGPDGNLLPQRADPYAFESELRPATASIVSRLQPVVPANDEQRRRANALDAPLSIYELHVGSWRRKVEDSDRSLTWRELADELIPYVQHMGFTHIELMPITEHPFDGSWGYQPTGLYAPTSRYGTAHDFREFVQRAHAAGVGVILDWVPAHFPSDAHGLANFDGTPLFEHADPREGFHKDWNTLIYNLGRHEVVNFLIGSALYWIERFGIDGLRVDAVASMLYRDYSRDSGEWLPNQHGGRENLEAVAFIRRLNQVIGVERGEAIMMAEESTAWPMVSRPPSAGGLGFHYKWNMGWMHDTLQFIARDSSHRKYHQNELTFGLIYGFDENFILPISHDEVVHGKGSLLARMPGDRWQRFANMRAYLGYQFTHPGKKLMFMGCEFAQEQEWNHQQSLDWHLLGDHLHRGIQSLVRDLNQAYRRVPALHQRDVNADGFSWIDHNDHEQSVLAFIRRGHEGRFVVVVCNFTPVPRYGYRIGVPQRGYYREILNTDSSHYGGGNLGNPDSGVSAGESPSHGHEFSLLLTLPPLAVIILEWVD